MSFCCRPVFQQSGIWSRLGISSQYKERSTLPSIWYLQCSAIYGRDRVVSADRRQHRLNPAHQRCVSQLDDQYCPLCLRNFSPVQRRSSSGAGEQTAMGRGTLPVSPRWCRTLISATSKDTSEGDQSSSMTNGFTDLRQRWR